MALVILIGASGAGKTAITEEIERLSESTQCLFFDSMGVPPFAEMVAKHGSGEGWQRDTTFAWLRKIKSEFDLSRPILFEGQSRIAFIREALEMYPVANVTVVLVDCNDEVRFSRLAHDRRQAELANREMMSWAAHLRAEAKEAGITILDTSELSLKASVELVKAYLV